MKVEHFRALNFCGYIANYERGLKSKKVPSKRRWEYLEEARLAIVEGNYQIAAYLIGFTEEMPEEKETRTRTKKKMRMQESKVWSK